MQAPQNPAGAYVAEESYSPQRRAELIAEIEAAPKALKNLVADLSEEQLSTRYRNWTIRQIVNHLADSHINAYSRFKMTLTEEKPTIKPYDETMWSELEEPRNGDVNLSLILLEGLHARWTTTLRAMTEAEFERCYFHPEFQKWVSLNSALAQYAWHCRHHIAQIEWLRKQHGWQIDSCH